MRSFALGALLLAGCLRTSVTHCDNGAICPSDQVCTENADSLCGPEERVTPCAGKAQFDGCTLADSSMQAGSCHSAICEPCTPEFAGCHYNGWTPMHSDATMDLHRVWVHSDADADAVGDMGTFVHYDGFAWSKSTTVAGLAGAAQIKGIWRSADDNVYIATSNNQLLRAPAGSDAWEMAAMIPGTSNQLITDIGGTSPRDIVAVGTGSLLVEFDGTNATTVTPPNGNTMYAIWMDASGDAFAVGLAGGVWHRANGVWTASSVGTTARLNSVWGRSPTDVWAVGEIPNGATAPTIVHFDGTAWTVPTLPGTLSAIPLNGVWGTTTDVWAVGQNGAIVHFDGTTWTSDNAGATMYAVAGSRDVFAVGEAGRIFRLTP